MHRFRRASASARVAFAFVAIYGLLLPAVTGVGTPMQAFLARGEVVCATGAPDSELPNGRQPGHECTCCIIGCAATGSDFSPQASSFLPRRFGTTVAWTPSPRRDAEFSHVVYFAARGPPRI